MQTAEIYGLDADSRDIKFRCRQQRYMVKRQTEEIYGLKTDIHQRLMIKSINSYKSMWLQMSQAKNILHCIVTQLDD